MIPDWKIWLAIFGLAAATYAIRFSFIGFVGGRPVAPWVRRVLAFVPAAVLPALIAPMVLTDGGALVLDAPKLLSAGAAFAAGIATRNVLAGILGGVAGYLVGQLMV
ncbi:MAG: AzlD domain-containing protein [Pikeienuella sp.]